MSQNSPRGHGRVDLLVRLVFTPHKSKWPFSLSAFPLSPTTRNHQLPPNLLSSSCVQDSCVKFVLRSWSSTIFFIELATEADRGEKEERKIACVEGLHCVTAERFIQQKGSRQVKPVVSDIRAWRESRCSSRTFFFYIVPRWIMRPLSHSLQFKCNEPHRYAPSYSFPPSANLPPPPFSSLPPSSI